MSDTQLGPEWWQANDGKWYPPSPRPVESPIPFEPSEPKPLWPWVLGLLGLFGAIAIAAAVQNSMEQRNDVSNRSPLYSPYQYSTTTRRVATSSTTLTPARAADLAARLPADFSDAVAWQAYTSAELASADHVSSGAAASYTLDGVGAAVDQAYVGHVYIEFYDSPAARRAAQERLAAGSEVFVRFADCGLYLIRIEAPVSAGAMGEQSVERRQPVAQAVLDQTYGTCPAAELPGG